jgi:hypothetical protein
MAQSAIGIFVGLPRATIEQLRDKAVALILEGKTIMSYGDGVTNASKQFAMPPQDMLNEAKYALLLLDGGRVRGLRTNYHRQVDR